MADVTQAMSRISVSSDGVAMLVLVAMDTQDRYVVRVSVLPWLQSGNITFVVDLERNPGMRLTAFLAPMAED